MNVIADSDGNLQVTGLDRLSASNCADFKQLVQLRLTEKTGIVELDCAGLEFVDSEGLGALIVIHKWLAGRSGRVRLVRPTPLLRQLLRLLRLEEIFEITA